MVEHKTQWKSAAAEALLAKHCARIPSVGKYSLGVLTGKIAAGRMVFLAVERFLNDLKRADAKDKDFPYHFDPGGAVAVIQFFRDLCPFKLEPFQQFIAANLFGWKKNGVRCSVHPHGHRRFQRAYIEIGKGNGKTPFAAGIGLYMVGLDEEPSAEGYIAAPSKAQAAICFLDAVKIVDGDEEHRELFALFTKRGCELPALSGNLSVGTSFLRGISAEHKTQDGPRPHVYVADEVHEHRSPLVINKLSAGFKARHQPLGFEITNSGWDRDTICWNHHDLSRQILEAIVQDESWFAYICQLDACDKCRLAGKEQPTCSDCDNWEDEKVWLKANPGLDTILNREYLAVQVKQAKNMPTDRSLIQRLNFCIWTQSESRFISPEAWRLCAWEKNDPHVGDPVAWYAAKLEALLGKSAYGGFDAGVVNDFTCLALDFPVQEGVDVATLMLWAWVPENVDYHNILKERYGYHDWVAGGFLKLTPGCRTDYSIVREDILALDRLYRIEECAFDRAYITQLVQELLGAGVLMVEHGQGPVAMTSPIKEFQRQILGQDFVHGMNPLLMFNVDNLVVKSDGKGNLTCMKPDNPNSPRKIDAAVATIMAKGRAAANPGAGGSVYDTRGVVVI